MTPLSFSKQCEFAKLPVPAPEYRFAPPRRWRFDWCWIEQKIAVEIEGGVFVNGRHSRGAGMVKDMEKYNTATMAGWRILRFTPQQVNSGEALTIVEQALRGIQIREVSRCEA